MTVLNTAARLRSQAMVRKTSRRFALAGLLALGLLSNPLERLWQTIVSAACSSGVSVICPGPVVQASCDKGPLIDPNGGCAH